MRRTYYRIGKQDKARRLPIRNREHHPTAAFWILPQPHPVTHLYQQKPDGRPKLAQFTTSTPAATAHRSSQAQIDGSLRCEISGPAWHESKQLIQVISIMYAHVPRPSTFCSIANTRKLSQNPRCGVVFDTRGNKYRLTAEINFRRSVRLGNKEYRKGAWKNSACAASFPRTI